MEFASIDRSKGAKEIYPSLGRCIYCRRNDLPLEDEHIVPFGIAGDGVIFEDASCGICSKFINKEFETHVIGSMFLPVRVRGDFPTRNKRKRATHLELKVFAIDPDGNRAGPVSSKMIPADQFPLALMGWSLPRPGIVAGREISDEVLGSPWTHMHDQEFAPYVAEYRNATGYSGELAVSVGRMEEDKFFRFLAKTAYAMAVAMEGLDAFEPFALDLIFGRSRAFCHYIGSGEGHDPQPMSEHETFRLLVGEIAKHGETYVAVLVQPFPMLNSPKYIVIVGKRFRDESPLADESTHA